MSALWLVLAVGVAGPPKLPPLPGRRMTPPPPEEPAKIPVDEPSPAPDGQTPPAASDPGHASSGTSPAAGGSSDAPATSPKSAAHGPPRPPPGALPQAKPAPRPPARAPKTGPQGTPKGAGIVSPLELAGAADLDAWADDDRRAAAPLTRAETPDDPTPRAPGDRPVRAPAPMHAGSEVVVRHATPEPDPTPRFRRGPTPPRRTATVVLAYRSYAIADALGRRQAWHLGAVEVTPFRRYFRLNLITEGGVEGGEAARAGDRADFQLQQKVAVGLQYPHWVTPFAEFHGGIGFARVEVFERNEIMMLWSMGLDAGVQWRVTKWMALHAAVGWVHPVFNNDGLAIAYDRVAFKVGFGF